MSSAGMQDSRSTHKNQLYFYTLAMNNPQRKLRKQFHLQEHQREEKFKLRNTFKKINAKFMLWKTAKHC